MRSALLGICFPDGIREVVRASTRITHTDPKAEWAAYAVALAAQMAHRESFVDPREYSLRMREAIADEEFLRRIDAVTNSTESTLQFAERNGVSGYCYHSVPVALHAWLHHQGDFRGTVLAAIHCGGDTDTTAAIAGAIAGAQCGAKALPQDWLSGLVEWPRTVEKMIELSGTLADTLNGPPQRARSPLFVMTIVRNAVFTAIVIGHILRRMIPL